MTSIIVVTRHAGSGLLNVTTVDLDSGAAWTRLYAAHGQPAELHAAPLPLPTAGDTFVFRRTIDRVERREASHV